MKCKIYKREVMSLKVQLCYSYRTSRTLAPGGGNGALVLMRQESNSTTLGTSEVCFTIQKVEVTLKDVPDGGGVSADCFLLYLLNYKGNQGLTKKKNTVISQGA